MNPFFYSEEAGAKGLLLLKSLSTALVQRLERANAVSTAAQDDHGAGNHHKMHRHVALPIIRL